MEEILESIEPEVLDKGDDNVDERCYEGDYPEIAAHYKSDDGLSDDELDVVADIAVNVVRSILTYFGAPDAPIDEYEGDEGELILDISAPDLAVLIGRHGRTLDSFQLLASLLVSRKLGFRYPVVVDVEGYKSRRKDKLSTMACSAASRAVRQGSSVKLPAMNPYERRLIHLALRDRDDVLTHSEGMDPERCVVVVPVRS